MLKRIILVLLLFSSCKNEVLDFVVKKPTVVNDFNDQQFIINTNFNKGDIRRYGIYPNKFVDQKKLNKVIVLASKGLPITFPKGQYDTNINIKGLKNVSLNFKDAVITGSIYIVEKGTVTSQRIQFNGTVKVLDKLFIRKSTDISFDDVIVVSDTLNNLFKKKNRGVSIYAGSKNISFNKLNIENTGGTENPFYKFTAAALQIHGYNNNPENIRIKDLSINNSDRTALYLTGDNHKFEKVTITNFGLGSSKSIFGLEDAIPGTEKEFSGAWLSKCNNVVIDSLEINQTVHKGVNSIRLDEGKYYEPTFINHIKITGFAKELNIADHKLTNILVKDEYE